MLKTASHMMWYYAFERVDRLFFHVDVGSDSTHKLRVLYIGISVVPSLWVAELEGSRGILPKSLQI